MNDNYLSFAQGWGTSSNSLMVIGSKVTPPNCNSGNWTTYPSSATDSITFGFHFTNQFILSKEEVGADAPSLNGWDS